ncbi:sensor histidine kinase [Micromonospora cathayae]|uniref:histidine kinase n=1 Tax=Micromonospora cathayae TaxID=3028804 RepID=A0ABY7ZYI6_9ACTN|nr:HAMP domain-containing sensor histidine kinase [Micromonospora sp. HUAS 3]WDZ88116.1 HAMP domain-containing sensor histidine kinase [Micromonospora sp. HUAS 3]
MRRAGLRTRVSAGFAAGALALSTSIALASYQLTRSSLLAERERTAVRAAYFDAAIVQSGLTGDRPDVIEVLRSLDTGGNRRAVLRRDGIWYARNVDAGVTTGIPARLQDLVADGTPAVQRIRVDGQPAVVVGVPLSATTAFYEVDYLQELEDTLRTVALVLTAVAVTTAAAGAAIGWHVTRYVLRPLRSVSDAAEEITAGDLTARLDPATEPDLARLTTSFNSMVDQLSRRLERDRRFAADVSHELRSPLQTLAAAASVLDRRREHLDDRTRTATDLITDEIARFQALVNDLLELARSDQPAERTPVAVADLARQVCRGRGLPENLVTATGPGTWLVDRRRVEQLLGNLLDNAVRYGGGPCAVRLSAGDGTYRVEVDDDGPGVDPQDRTVIFDRFVRGRGANARGGSDGTGLGLALVAQHAAAHGGRALVDDRPGGGARFRVELREPRC